MDQNDRKAWQKRCVDVGFTYWRAPDSHGVTCTKEQAETLLAELLGVEVEIERAPLIEAKIEEAIDDANRKFNGRRQGPSGQQLTTYDDWKYWLVREVERAHGIGA